MMKFAKGLCCAMLMCMPDGDDQFPSFLLSRQVEGISQLPRPQLIHVRNVLRSAKTADIHSSFCVWEEAGTTSSP